MLLRWRPSAFFPTLPLFRRSFYTPLNQTLLALAAYNAGPGRVKRLRAEAASQVLDPNIWRNNVELIAARRIGAETVTFAFEDMGSIDSR
jgi:hypothetical protein